MRRAIYVSLGLLCIGLGVLGIVTPILPTTPFLLLAAGLLAHASPRLHRWLHRNRVTGPFLKAYTEGAGMSRKRKAGTIAMLWITLLVSAWFVRSTWWVLLILAGVGIGVTIHIATIRPGSKY